MTYIGRDYYADRTEGDTRPANVDCPECGSPDTELFGFPLRDVSPWYCDENADMIRCLACGHQCLDPIDPEDEALIAPGIEDTDTYLIDPEFEDSGPINIECECLARKDSEALRAAYRERAHFLADFADRHRAVFVDSAPDLPEMGILYVHTRRAGQMSWHVHPLDFELFPHVRRVPPTHHLAVWDGHSDSDKYARLASLRTSRGHRARRALKRVIRVVGIR